MPRYDTKYLTPGAGETLEFTTTATVSGIDLIQNANYRIACDADVWVELDDGGGGMGAADSQAMLMTNSVEYLRTTDDKYILHALGVTSSGLLNYVLMEEV